MESSNMALNSKNIDLSFLDDVPDDINSAEDFEKNIAALKKYKELLDEADKDKIN